MTEHLTAARLTALGRDREAVAAALDEAGWQAPDRAPRGGEDMDGVQQLDQVIPLLREVVAGIGEADLDRPTPCTEFTVTGVLEHMVGGAGMFAPAFRGEEPGAPLEGHVLERWQTAMGDLLASVHADGARDRTLQTPFGAMPGEAFARYVAFDGLMHAWDLSRATGQAVAPDPDLVAAVDAYARGLIVPEMRDGDTFAAEVEPPAEAGPLDRLAAFSGRAV